MLVKFMESVEHLRAVPFSIQNVYGDRLNDPSAIAALVHTSTSINKGSGPIYHQGDTFWYVMTLNDVSVLGPLRLEFVAGPDWLPTTRDIQVVAFDPYDEERMGLANLDCPISSRSEHNAAEVWENPERTLTSAENVTSDGKPIGVDNGAVKETIDIRDRANFHLHPDDAAQLVEDVLGKVRNVIVEAFAKTIFPEVNQYPGGGATLPQYAAYAAHAVAELEVAAEGDEDEEGGEIKVLRKKPLRGR